MSRIRTRFILLVVALATVAALLVSCGGGGGSETRTLTVIDASGAQGAAVTVHVRLNSFLGVGGYHIVLNFNPARLQLDAASVAKGTGVPAASVLTKDTTTPGVIDATVTGTGTFTGTDVLVATFTIIAPSASGTHNAITMPTAALSDPNGLPKAVTGVGGNVITN